MLGRYRFVARRRVPLILLASLLAVSGGRLVADDVVILTDGSAIEGTLTSLAPAEVVIEARQAGGQRPVAVTIPIAAIGDLRLADEPEGLTTGRALLRQGDGRAALAELQKIAAIELQEGVVGPRVRREHAFVKAAAEALAAAAEQGGGAGEPLAAYLDRNARSHHFYEGQVMLGAMLAAGGNLPGAMAAYARLDDGPPTLRMRAANLRAELLAGAGRFAEAAREFASALDVPLPEAGGSDAEQRARAIARGAAESERRGAALGRARCLAESGGAAEAIATVRQLIREADPDDRDLLAAAYGTLGACQRASGSQDAEALISYLTVDLVFDGVPEWHARALFNLAELWESSNHPERARQARQLLATAYPDSPWTKRLGGARGRDVKQ